MNISSVDLSTCFNEYLCLNVNGLLILVIYRSPHSDSKNNQNLLSLLKEFLSIKGSKVICGDFNLPNINWSQMYTTASNKSFDDIFLQFILDNYLFQCVSKPTRSRNQQKMNILDLVLTPSDELINNLIHKAPLGKSDHCILCFDCNLSCPELLLDNSVGKYNFSKGNYLGMNEYINKHLSVIIDIGDDYDVNRLWETFVYVVKTAAEIFIPRYKKKCNSKFGKGSNWGKTNLDIKLSNDVYDLIKKKNKLWSRYIKTKNVEWLNKFKKIRNLTKTKIREQKETFYLKLANNIKINPKLFWKHINSKRKTKTNIHDLRNIDAVDGSITWIYDSKEKANYLGKSFTSVFNDCIDDIPDGDLIFKSPIIYEAMSEIKISELVIIKKLTKLNVYKSAGPDDLFPKILRECAVPIARFLNILYSTTMSVMTIPDQWRSSIVTAVFKKGDRHIALNYRPISLTCVACKIFESIVKNHLVSFFQSNKLFHVNQFGFMKGRSTSLQLLKLMDIWSEAVDNGYEVDVLYTDFEKAFDKVNHKKLLYKLNKYGVNDSVVKWIEDYLKSRRFQVKVNGELSEWFDVTSGVPQGSVLGPVLFVIYVNDMFELCDGRIDMYLYADDAKIFTIVKTVDDQLILQLCINKLVDWCKVWDFKLNTEKCNIVQYNYKGFDFCYKIAKNNLNLLSNINDLGVIFEDGFKFEIHIIKKIA